MAKSTKKSKKSKSSRKRININPESIFEPITFTPKPLSSSLDDIPLDLQELIAHALAESSPDGEVPQELFKGLLENLSTAFEDPPSFDELYAQYQNDNELLTDFASVVEEQAHDINCEFIEAVENNARSFAELYFPKLEYIYAFIVYVEALSQHTNDFIGKPNKYNTKLSQTQIGRFAKNAICNIKKSSRVMPADFETSINIAVRGFFSMMENMMDPEHCGMIATNYRKFTQECKEVVDKFTQSRVDILCDINDCLLRLNRDDDELLDILDDFSYEPFDEYIASYDSTLEPVLSNEKISMSQCVDDLPKLEPQILQLMAKYSAFSFRDWCDDCFNTFHKSNGMSLDEFMAKMAKQRKKRLGSNKGSHAKQVKSDKKVTFTLKEVEEQWQTPDSKSTNSKATDSKTAGSKTPDIKLQDDAIHEQKTITSVKNSNGEEISLLSQQERHDLMAALQKQNPHPKSELNYHNNFELLCSVVLSAQATDKSVNLATTELFKAAPTPKAMADLGIDGIAPYIKSIGLWSIKAERLVKLAQKLHEDYNDEIPDTYEELIKLPGVGSKTAKVVLNVAFGQPYIAVDTHVFRVCNRTGLCLGNSPSQVEKRLPDLVDPEFVHDAHHYLLLHGRYVCTARGFRDHCATCVAAPWCKHHNKVD